MDKGKVYIAARYSRRDEMRAASRRLNEVGIRVTSRWLSEDKPLNTQLGDDSKEFYRETANIDLDDVRSADTLLFFAEDPKIGTPRGGRHVEFGVALALNKRIVVIGGEENIFHYLHRVIHFPTLEEFVESETRQ